MKWTLFVSDNLEFKALSELFRALYKNSFEEKQTALGGRVVHTGSEGPSLALVPDNLSTFRSLVEWIHRELHAKAFISTGSCPYWLESSKPFFVPQLGLRTVGLVNANGPLLFEELPFDSEIQSELRKRTQGEIEESSQKLPSCEMKEDDEELKLFLHQHLGVFTSDRFTGELLVMGKRLSVRVACLKRLTHEDQPNRSPLIQMWESILKAH